MKNFSCDQDGQALTATGATQPHALTGLNVDHATDVMIDNPGPVDVFIRTGPSNAVATAVSKRVPAGAQVVYDKGNGTHIALLSAGADQAVVVHVSRGS